MPKAKKIPKARIPELGWSEDNYKLTWEFLNQLEKDENYKVLFGKKDPSENTSGDTRIGVFKRIAKAILPFYFELDGATVAERLKGKLESLTRTYRKHAARLRRTGEGLDENSQNDGDSQNEVMDYYIPGDGPTASTPAHAVNLWQQIEREFPFFPRLHRIFSSRPNVTPIAVTTALGPDGRKTVWFQDPDDDVAASRPAPTVPSASPVRTFGSNVTNTPPVAPPTPNVPPPARTPSTESVAGAATPAGKKRPPKPSGVLPDAIEKARSQVEKVPQKRTLIDTLVEMNEKNQRRWDDEAREKLLLQKRAQLLEEFKLQLWTKDQYHEQIELLVGGGPSKRQKVADQESADKYSDDWDLSNFNSD